MAVGQDGEGTGNAPVENQEVAYAGGLAGRPEEPQNEQGWWATGIGREGDEKINSEAARAHYGGGITEEGKGFGDLFSNPSLLHKNPHTLHDLQNQSINLNNDPRPSAPDDVVCKNRF